MRIGVINVKKLTRVRDTFKPAWRIIVTTTFLLSVFLWLAAAHQLKSLSLVVYDPTIRTRTLILAAVVLPPLAAAVFRKSDFGRLFFALSSAFNLTTISLLMLLLVYGVLSWRGLEQALAFFCTVMLFMLWVYHLMPCYVLFFSLIPFGRWKAYRQQVNYSLRLWSGEWKGLDEAEEVGPGEKPYLTPGARYRLAFGGLFFLLGGVFVLTSIYSAFEVQFLPAVYGLELSRAWNMLKQFPPPNPAASLDTFSDNVLAATNSISLLLLGLFCFFVFGFFLTQWRRENVTVYRLPLLQHMTPSDLLLLRSFNDDMKYVARSKNAIWMMLFGAYSWSYTFEQLIVERLKYLGRVRLMDIRDVRERLLEKRGMRFIAALLGKDRLRKLLIYVFPAIWYKLPAQGGIRHYVEGDWQEEIAEAMPRARVSVVLLGTTPGLKGEMDRIEQLRLWEKTIFVMPPLIRKKNYRARWQHFIDLVCAAHDCDRRPLERINSKRVLAAVVRRDTLVVITGKKSSQKFYESALDVAALLTVADPEQSRKLIPKYLK
jgi:hypothetical protein